MPTQRFLNLPYEKRKKIKQAAIHEFSKCSFSNVSINQIVKESDISRGSFYTYFEDKEDLLAYLLKDFQVTCREWFFQVLDLCRGNIFLVFWKAVDRLVSNGKEQQDFEFYRNIFMDTKLAYNTKMIGLKGLFQQNYNYQDLISSCYKKMNRSICPIRNEEELMFLLDLLFILSIKTLLMYFMDTAKKEEILEMFKYQLDLIQDAARIKTRKKIG